MTDADDAQYRSIANPRRTTLLHRSAIEAFMPRHDEGDTPDEAAAG